MMELSSDAILYGEKIRLPRHPSRRLAISAPERSLLVAAADYLKEMRYQTDQNLAMATAKRLTNLSGLADIERWSFVIEALEQAAKLITDLADTDPFPPPRMAADIQELADRIASL